METLGRTNKTLIFEITLLGFRNLHPPQILLLSMAFSMIYILTVVGNILIVIIIVTEPQLHTPMYFFLANLSCLETCYTTNIIPAMISGFLMEGKHFSINGCLLQAYFFGSLGATECFLLAEMAYDRYLAICYPLHYTILMNHLVCIQLAIGTWLGTFISIGVVLYLVSKVLFCGSQVVDHFFCDSALLLKLACTDTEWIGKVLFFIALIVTLIPFLLTAASYISILSTVLRIPSSSGRQKTFSTCSSHLTVVTLFYGTLIIMYVAPSSNWSPGFKKGLSLLYTIVTPMFNPIIYSLRNKDVKEALRKMINKSL